jgi:hypothetical protein
MIIFLILRSSNFWTISSTKSRIWFLNRLRIALANTVRQEGLFSSKKRMSMSRDLASSSRLVYCCKANEVSFRLMGLVDVESSAIVDFLRAKRIWRFRSSSAFIFSSLFALKVRVLGS